MEEIMKNIIRRGLCLLLLLAMTAAMAACGPKNTNTDADEKTMVYAVEAGSAGEDVAKEKGWTVNSVQDQAAALMEVAAGTSDAAVIDLLMAGAMIGPDTSYPDLTYTDSLTQEEYCIGCRQGSDLADFITSVLAEAYQDGTTQTLAQQFGIREDLLAEMPQTGYTEDAGGDVAYIQGKGTLVVGITEFAPMDYKDDNGQWTGFDAELARLVAQRLGVDVEFVIIEWGQKVNELNSKAIDVVWNGMTLTDAVQETMECSNAYCNNAQVVIVPADKASEYQTVESVKDLTFAAEAGSAGEAELTALGYTVTPVKAQSDALMEVAAGTSDAAVIDSLMAAAMVGEGTGYASLTYTCGLNSEEYGVGFRKGSDLAQKLNDFFQSSYADGSMMQIAETYGVQAAIIEQK